VNPLIAVLNDPSPNIRAFAVVALGNIKDSRAVEPLIAVLKQPNVAVNGVQSDAFTIMPEHGPQIRFEDSGLRGRAINSLGQIKDPRAVDSLVAALTDQNANVRENAGGALGEIKDTRAVEPLIAAIKDTKTGCAAVAALGEINDTRAINP